MTITQILTLRLPQQLVTEIIASHYEAKSNFYLGGLRLSGVEGGRFAEATFRCLEHLGFGNYTPIGTQLDTEGVIRRLANLPRATTPESIRVHIPRVLRVIYDIRNSRDLAHLADGIDPNLQDATLVTSNLDWVLAELIRLSGGIQANEAQRLVDDIMTRQAPVIQDFDGFLKVLKPGLNAGDHLMLLLYQRGDAGATYEELVNWSRSNMRANLRQTLNRLVERKLYVHLDGIRYQVTRTGQRYVEQEGLMDA